MSPQESPIFRFAGFELDPGERKLMGPKGAINLSPKVFHTLVLLVEKAGHAVGKDELMNALWPRGFVEESNLSRHIWLIRNALDDHGAEPRFIETLPKLGYRFIAPVDSSDWTTPGFDRRTSNASADADEPTAGDASSAAMQPSADVAETPATTRVPARGLTARRIPRNRYLLLALLLIAAIIAAQFAWRYATRGPRPVQVLVGTNATVPGKSIAVLPFENLSPDDANAYFAVAIQDEILTRLTQIGDLEVTSRTSTEKYKSRPDDLKAIAQNLGVATVLEGSVQKAGNQVLINVQLINARTDRHIWAQNYQRTLDNIFGLEGEVADKVAKALNARLTPAEAKAVASIPTHNKQAYDAFLRGEYYLYDAQGQDRPDEFERSVTFLLQAVKHDPGFSDAFSALAAAYRHMGGHDDQAEAAASRALTLNPSSAFAHIQMARLLGRQGEFRQALEQGQAAVRLKPNSSGMINGLGNIYANAGRYEEALAAYKRAIALDPSPDARTQRSNVGGVLVMQRRYAAARDTYNFIAVRDPSAIREATALANVYESGWGDLASARKVLQAVPTPVASSGALSDAWYSLDLYQRDYAAALNVIGAAPVTWFTNKKYPLGLYRGLAYQAQGDGVRAKAAFAEARKQLEKWLEASPGDADIHAELALALAGLGEGDQARREAQRAVTLQPLAKDPEDSPDQLTSLAMVEARIGDSGAAIHLLNQLLSMPAGLDVSVPLLKLDPAWDPIRKDPRFQALLTPDNN